MCYVDYQACLRTFSALIVCLFVLATMLWRLIKHSKISAGQGSKKTIDTKTPVALLSRFSLKNIGSEMCKTTLASFGRMVLSTNSKQYVI